MTMGEKIKMHRTRLGLSQEALGAKVGVNKAAVQKWERGTVENIKRSNIKFLADLFEISPCDLMCWDEPYDKEVNLIEQIQNQYGEEAVQLLQCFAGLNAVGQARALESICDLTEIPKYTESEKIYVIKKAARNGSFEEKAITNKEVDEIKNLPDVDDLK